MDIIKKYNELDKRICSQPKEKIKDFFTLDVFSQKLINTAKQNNYILHSHYGSNPRVVLLGFTHKGNEINQEEELMSTLKNSMNYGDILASEGNGLCEIIYEFHQYNDLVGKLKDFFIEKDIRTIFNDDKILILNFMQASSKLRLTEEKYDKYPKNPEYITAIENYLQTLKARDDNFCKHKSGGIIPLIKDTAKIYKKPKLGAKIFQLVGTTHIYTENMQKCLEEAKVPYLVFVPNKKYSN